MKFLLASLFIVALSYNVMAKDNSTKVSFPPKDLFEEHVESVSPLDPTYYCTSDNQTQLIHLTAENMAIMKGHVEAGTSDSLIRDLMSAPSDDVYVYLDTPGGSVIDGSHIIEAIKVVGMKGKRVHCIADTAMSMGFAILQSCPDRLVKENSVLMQHQMAVRTGGELEKLKSRMNFYDQLHETMAAKESARLGLTVEEYNDLMMNEYYVFGSRAVDEGVADRVVCVDCDPHLINEEYSTTFYTPFGPIDVYFSRCPLLKQPTKFKMKRDGSTEDKNCDTKNLFKEWSDYCKNYDFYSYNSIDNIYGFTPKYSCDTSVISAVMNIYSHQN